MITRERAGSDSNSGGGSAGGIDTEAKATMEIMDGDGVQQAEE
eukprot:CAMPEP_0195016704 /NCGR_PEP_ID=MMETSP0326_2-20130528/25210_1 /TAXON_ID=2866 ORGANISM="Crypthecodinium cohnii, Strain Seligo" /NCGR_SAMPLE_ID=MMETSP0326_2 /ASSEMBLY_ACC=CAM_ASM_000348 /LENGTH=42 /DNA_ID= /DNA_START= /DNA_END= /DNA_ORIENTATION=